MRFPNLKTFKPKASICLSSYLNVRRRISPNTSWRFSVQHAWLLDSYCMSVSLQWWVYYKTNQSSLVLWQCICQAGLCFDICSRTSLTFSHVMVTISAVNKAERLHCCHKLAGSHRCGNIFLDAGAAKWKRINAYVCTCSQKSSKLR